MKRIVSLLLCLIISTAALFSCDGNCEPLSSVGRADNEILTYDRIDPKKTVITVSRTGNIYIDELSRAFEAANPDVQVICLDITGGTSYSKPVLDLLLNGDAADIMFYIDGSFTDEVLIEYFETLSAKEYIADYQKEALNRLTVGSDIYALPGPSTIDCMIYNKTLFDKYDWQVPETFDEFVSLCVRINKDTNGDIEGWNPNAKYSQELMNALEAFAYGEVFAGVDNRTWYHDFCGGNATFKGHMEPMYKMMAALADNDIVREEHFSYSATTRGKEFAAGKIAMINYDVTVYESSEYEFSYFPFPGKNEGDGYIVDSLSCCVGVPKKEHTAKERDAIERYLEFFSTIEGQQVFIGGSLMVSNLMNVPLNKAEYLSPLQATIDKGQMFNCLDFYREGYSTAFSIAGGMRAIVNGEKTADECIAAVDAHSYDRNTESTRTVTDIAVADEDFTVLETSNYFADMYRAKSGADIALIANNLAYRGNLMKILKGTLTSDNIEPLKPRSLDNNTTLIKVSMTGKQLIDALNDPFGNDIKPNCIYAFSGLKCIVAPWSPLGEKYLSVALADGTPIDETKLYTVAIWSGTVNEKYITETVEKYEGTFEELLTAKLAEDKVIVPAKDGRITLIYD